MIETYVDVVIGVARRAAAHLNRVNALQTGLSFLDCDETQR